MFDWISNQIALTVLLVTITCFSTMKWFRKDFKPQSKVSSSINLKSSEVSIQNTTTTHYSHLMFHSSDTFHQSIAISVVVLKA